MVVYNAHDINAAMKKIDREITDVEVWHEEFGEGYDTHVRIVWENGSETYQVGEEEVFSKAKARGQRLWVMFIRNGYSSYYKGVES